jgi:hypothetical protein
MGSSVVKITICYRRQDSDAVTGRIFDRLVAHYGKQSIFRDIDNIPPGVDFRAHINTVLGESNVLLAVVGRKWLGVQKSGRKRIFEENDPVRVEIETALNRGMTVVPILTGASRMPDADGLPPAIKDFAFRHALIVDQGQDFDHHMDRLIRSIDRILGDGTPTLQPGANPESPLSLQRDIMVSGERAETGPRNDTALQGWGGYSRAAVADYIGSYLVVRPAFRVPDNLYAYVTDIDWDSGAGGLIFRERNRPDGNYAHTGQVWIPSMSMYLYLVAIGDGWLRSVILSVLDPNFEMRGIISTLHNFAGSMYVPAAAPIVYSKRESFGDEQFGELSPADAKHKEYSALLRDTVDNTFVRIAVPQPR